MASRRGRMLDGVLLLDKPEGLSSNHALQRARAMLDARKAGHTGTLDPFATGLLVCCFGRATKLSARMLEADKVYEATLTFGEETDSGDRTGRIVARAAIPPSGVDPADLEAALAGFRGEIEQIPPMISALKRDGKPLYEYARRGLELERPARRITIHALDVQAFDGQSVQLRVHCSKGTYVRALAQDIGRRLGCLAYLSALRRTAVGPFLIEHAVGLDALQAMAAPERALLPLNMLPDGLRPTDKIFSEETS